MPARCPPRPQNETKPITQPKQASPPRVLVVVDRIEAKTGIGSESDCSRDETERTRSNKAMMRNAWPVVPFRFVSFVYTHCGRCCWSLLLCFASPLSLPPLPWLSRLLFSYLPSRSSACRSHSLSPPPRLLAAAPPALAPSPPLHPRRQDMKRIRIRRQPQIFTTTTTTNTHTRGRHD